MELHKNHLWWGCIWSCKRKWYIFWRFIDCQDIHWRLSVYVALSFLCLKFAEPIEQVQITNTDTKSLIIFYTAVVTYKQLGTGIQDLWSIFFGKNTGLFSGLTLRSWHLNDLSFLCFLWIRSKYFSLPFQWVKMKIRQFWSSHLKWEGWRTASSEFCYHE